MQAAAACPREPAPHLGDDAAVFCEGLESAFHQNAAEFDDLWLYYVLK